MITSVSIDVSVTYLPPIGVNNSLYNNNVTDEGRGRQQIGTVKLPFTILHTRMRRACFAILYCSILYMCVHSCILTLANYIKSQEHIASCMVDVASVSDLQL